MDLSNEVGVEGEEGSRGDKGSRGDEGGDSELRPLCDGCSRDTKSENTSVFMLRGMECLKQGEVQWRRHPSVPVEWVMEN